MDGAPPAPAVLIVSCPRSVTAVPCPRRALGERAPCSSCLAFGDSRIVPSASGRALGLCPWGTGRVSPTDTGSAVAGVPLNARLRARSAIDLN